MSKTPSEHCQRGSIRPRRGGFQVRVYAGRDPLTKQRLYLTKVEPTMAEAATGTGPGCPLGLRRNERRGSR
ncbi:hypothetical protein [Streptomyces sp. 7N604]|uniref:hypothetical protein n=1 Tax=Streptomyces sp. 7N604 TaxID=3457415 RepID=UPI003FD58C1A